MHIGQMPPSAIGASKLGSKRPSSKNHSTHGGTNSGSGMNQKYQLK